MKTEQQVCLCLALLMVLKVFCGTEFYNKTGTQYKSCLPKSNFMGLVEVYLMRVGFGDKIFKYTFVQVQ